MIGTFILIAILVAVLFIYRRNVLQRFDQDPAQHRLMELLLGLAVGRRDVTEAGVRAYLDQVASSPRNRRARVIHAVLLARKGASPQTYTRLVEISRKLG